MTLRYLLRLVPAKDNVLGLYSKAHVFTTSAEPPTLCRPTLFDPFGRAVEEFKPVITIPVPVQKRALKRQDKIRRESIRKSQAGINDGDRSRCVLRCRVKGLDHFMGQNYDRYKKIPLATEMWQNKGTKGDHFSILPHKRPTHKITDRADVSFSDYEEIDPRLVEALSAAGYRRPTYIQDRSIPTVLAGKSMVIASEAGNGKTLAYLVPVMQRALEARDAEREAGTAGGRKNAPLAIIAVPGLELAGQVRSVAMSIAQPLGIKVGMVTGGNIERKLADERRYNVDILVGSFGGLEKLLRGGLYSPRALRHVVYDEADTLLDDTFNQESVPLLSFLSRGGSAELQVLLVGATFPTNLGTIMGSVMEEDELEHMRTNYVHRVPPHIHQKFIRVGKVGKPLYLLDAISGDVEKGRPVVVFCNKNSTSQFVSHFLKGRNIRCVTLNKDTDTHERRKNIRKFLSGDVNVLSCTDLASRGIDTSNAMHVVNYDFPMNMSDYLHRVGRVGRVASPANCRATHFVQGGIQAKVAQDVETAVRTKSELNNVNNNIVKIIEHRAEVSKQRQEERQRRREHRDLAEDANREHQQQQQQPSRRHSSRRPRPSTPSGIDQ